MPNYSENLNLILPAQSENYNVDVANTNNKTIDAQVGNKVDKIVGKSLSTNDFTNAYKRKLDTLQNIYKFKGSVNSQTELLAITGQNSGDVYNVIQENKDYAWTGIEWVELGSATNTEDLATKDEVKTSIRGTRSSVTLTEAIPQNTNYTIPFSYIVGSNDLSVYYEGVLCVKGKDYIEVGTAGEESTTIQLKDGQRRCRRDFRVCKEGIEYEFVKTIKNGNSNKDKQRTCKLHRRPK